ncbi:MAG: gliding motility-associated C-terminal domain-containing protein [Bacteroidia bacterium]|nr:gliding motility-associated C-terminal domain-containing protein [Bacteroidia bacterium]
MRYFFLIIAILLPAISEAQLSAPGRSATRYTSYFSSPGVNDPVFIYCNASGSQKGTLNASSPGGTAPFSYSWYRWNEGSNSFTIIPGVTTSSISNLDEGGYQVRITDLGGYDTSLAGWIFIDKPYSLAELQNRTCDYVALKGKAVIDTFYYKDPSNGNPLKLPNGIKFLWSSNPASTIPSPDLYLSPNVTYDPPLVDVIYKLQVSDSFGCISESSFSYESIRVKADFSVDPEKGEAPLEVTFTDKSIRGLNYKWELGDGSIDSISYLNNPEPHTYYKPGEYFVTLTIESDKHCIDSMRFNKIWVEPSELKIPNVFTPDGDTFNDNFMVESKSLRNISVEVFSRSGMKVYSFYGDGERLREWKGWDGNVNASSIKAGTGVYFYIIRAYGWDDVDYNSKEYRGFVYLYR